MIGSAAIIATGSSSSSATAEVVNDPSFSVVWDAGLTIDFSGPSGAVGTLQAAIDVSCTPNAEMLCTVEATPISLSGVLPPGSYDLNIELATAAEGSWLPSVGAIGAFVSGSYEVSLQITPAADVPALSPSARLLLALGIGVTGLGLGRRFY